MALKLLKTYQEQFKNKEFVRAWMESLLFIGLSLIVNFYAGTYATHNASNPVADIILSNLPLYDVDWLFVYGPLIFWVAAIGICLLQPGKMPYILKNIALLTIVRSFFISLTHIAPFPMRLHISPDSPISDFTFGGDLFFSGHTSFPFLWAMIFWENVTLRVFFVTCSIFFGSIVLLAHLHYSIDVFAAFFMAHSVSHIGRKLFKKEARLFQESGKGLTLFGKTLE